ncbi:DNA-binding SARP family transcriptional activator [Micromonospora sp. A200]|nr:DNA-binding SARP family transcriptional activator [Micromonospora sp. A200]
MREWQRSHQPYIDFIVMPLSATTIDTVSRYRLSPRGSTPPRLRTALNGTSPLGTSTVGQVLEAPAELPPLRGRDHELTAVAEFLDALSMRHGAAVLAEGEAGIGRSALLARAAELATSRGYAVARVAADVLEQRIPLGAARQVFQTLDRDRSDSWPGGGSLGVGGLYEFFDRWWAVVARTTSHTPLLIVVDDLHWSDDLSLRWLAYLLRRCQSTAVGVLAAVPAGERAGRPLLAEVTGRLRRLPLAGLDRGAIARVAREALATEPDEEFVAVCQHGTAGNPRLLHELLTEIMARGAPPTALTARRMGEFATPAMAHSLLAPVYRADPAAIALLRAVAAVDGSAEPDLAARLARLDPGRAAQVADGLVRRRIFRDGHPLTFVHPLLATAIAREIGPANARRAHARAARLLHQAGRDDTEVAAHLVRASPAGEPWAVPVLRQAARAALAQGDATTAVGYLQRAVREPRVGQPHADLLAELGAAELLVDMPTGMKRLATALAAADDEATRGRVVSELANGLLADRRGADTLELLDGAAERVAGRDPELARRLQLQALCATVSDLTQAPELDRRLGTLALGEDSGPAVRRAVAAARAVQEGRLGISAARTVALARQALAAGPPGCYDEVVPYWAAVVSLTRAEHLDAAPAFCADADRKARGLGWRLNEALAAAVRGRVCHLTGYLVDAEQYARRAFSLMAEIGADPDRSWVLHGSMLVYVLIERGRLDEAEALLGRGGFAPGANGSTWPLELLAARGLLRLTRDDLRGALADLHEYGRGLESVGVRSAGYEPWRAWAALAHHRLGEAAEARWLAAEQLELSRRWGSSRALGIALGASGVVTGGAEGIPLLGEAVLTLEASPARPELAKALLDHGIALRDAGRRSDAHEQFSRALALATRCAADSAARRARAELRFTVPVPGIRRAGGEPSSRPDRALLVRCFGGFHFELSDRRLDWAAIRPRVRTLLRFLGVHAQRPVHRERILAALWPELPTKAGIRNLHVGISTLRTFLEPGVGRAASRFIRRDGESYLLVVPDGGLCDVWVFEESVTTARRALAAGRVEVAADGLRGALAHYSGDLLPEDGPAEWVVVERDRYRVMAAESAAVLAGIELDAGRHDAAVDAARRSVQLDRFRDEAWRTLASAYRDSGDAAAAERTWRAYEAVLESLGVTGEAGRDPDGRSRAPNPFPRTLHAHGRLKNSTSPRATRRPRAAP